MRERDGIVMSMPGVEANESELRERLAAILRATPPLMQVRWLRIFGQRDKLKADRSKRT